MSSPKYVGIYGFTGIFGGGLTLPIRVDSNGFLIPGPPANNTNSSGFFAANVDNIPAATFGVTGISFNYGFNPTTGFWERMRTFSSTADAVPTNADGNQLVLSENLGFNGTSFDRIRIANIFKNVQATSLGNTPLWTPASGKKFRLMGYTISVSGTLAATATEIMQLRDGSTTILLQHVSTIVSITPQGDTQIGVDLGQGILSAAANNVLNINLSTAMSSGLIAVNAWGTEE